jgi:hypothetical protein
MLNTVAVLNLAFLITHQVDAAFWHEWDMFGIPGGIQFFDLFNLVAFAVLLACFVTVIQRRRSGYWGSIVILSTSAVVLPIHAGFALAGFTEFHLPVSMLAIAGTFALSVWQLLLTIQHKAEFCQA